MKFHYILLKDEAQTKQPFIQSITVLNCYHHRLQLLLG